MENTSQLARIVEAALFAARRPLSIEDLLALFTEDERPEKSALREAVAALEQDYEKRAIELKELATGFQFVVKPDLSPWVSRLWEERAPRYSRALLETLALVAYRQPITRGEIEDVRGVAVSTHIMRTLIEREWVRVVGHRDVPGKPAIYATTKTFLDYFGLKRLQDLPPLSELQDLDKVAEQLEQADAPSDDEAQLEAEITDETALQLSESQATEFEDEEEIVVDEAELEEAMKFAKSYNFDDVINPGSDEEITQDEDALTPENPDNQDEKESTTL